MVDQKRTVQQRILERASRRRAKILLPEASLDGRTLHAAVAAHTQDYVDVVLVGEEAKIAAMASRENVDVRHLPIIDPSSDKGLLDSLASEYSTRRAKEKLTAEEALAMVSDPLYFAALLVSRGDADGMVAGAVATTADVLRASIKCIGLQENIRTVSSYFIMVIPGCSQGDDGVMLFADCAVAISPTVEQLADIAISTAASAKSLLGMEPRVAMLSFSTHGSAAHPKVKKVRDATLLVNQLRPDILCDGELQGDAALIESIASKKAPGSKVAGKANVLIFPDLDSGNIAYKLVQRLANAEAIGPILQGLAKSVNDLSRGCSVKDIQDVIAITAAKAHMLR